MLPLLALPGIAGVVSLASAVRQAAPPVPYAYRSYEDRMQYKKLGTSDILVSSCCLGTMTWGNQNTDEEAAAQLNGAFELGCNFLDTAECYPVPVSQEKQGATDRAIAKWLRSNGRARDEVVIASKVCGYNERFTWLRGEPTRVTREQIVASVDSSLERLGVDHLDLLQVHWPDRYVPLFGSTRYDCSKERADAVPFEEQATAMGELFRSGKIRSWGLSNETPLGVCEFVAACKSEGAPAPVSVQNSYSLLQRSDETGLVEALRHHDVSYLPYSPLSAGVLSGKYRGLDQPPRGSRLELFGGYFERYSGTRAPAAVEAYCELAQLHGMSPAALAIAFCESRPFVTSTIIGATSMAQLEDNMAGFGVEWTDELEAGVAAIAETYPDPWRMLVRDGG
jgi:aryl-alcohol dehydrogenase-like predicted oxidoreductase